LPEETRSGLRARALEAAALGLRVDEVAAAVLHLLLRAGIPVVLIKGVARRALAPRYPMADARVTRDVDLLVPAGELAAAFECLRAAGFTPAAEAFPDAAHLPPLWDARRVAVELHGSWSIRVPAPVAWQRATAAAVECQWQRLPVRTPSPTELAWQAGQHALTRSFAEGFRLEKFLEVAALVAGDAPIDWSEIATRPETEPACDPAGGAPLPPRCLALWFMAARSLGGAENGSGFDLATLLEWRRRVLMGETAGRSRLAERLLEESTRRLAGAPPQAAPPEASRWKRLRRTAAGRAARLGFSLWRSGR
jgi:hypothetical protein